MAGAFFFHGIVTCLAILLALFSAYRRATLKRSVFGRSKESKARSKFIRSSESATRELGQGDGLSPANPGVNSLTFQENMRIKDNVVDIVAAMQEEQKAMHNIVAEIQEEQKLMRNDFVAEVRKELMKMQKDM